MDIVPAGLKDILRRQLELASDVAITPDTTFESLNADSLDIMQVVLELEDSCDISIPDRDLSKPIVTIGDLCDILAEKHAAL